MMPRQLHAPIAPQGFPATSRHVRLAQQLALEVHAWPFAAQLAIWQVPDT